MNLEALISRGESETLEFKKSTGEWKEIIKTISAFSNTKGGKIIIGVSKIQKLLGVEIGKDTIEHLTNKISHTIAHKELRELVGKGIFRKSGAGKYVRYMLTQG